MAIRAIDEYALNIPGSWPLLGSRPVPLPTQYKQAAKASFAQNKMASKAKEYNERLSHVKSTTVLASYAAKVAFNRYYGIQSTSVPKRSQLPFRPSPPPSFTSSCPSSTSLASSPSLSTLRSISFELRQSCYDLVARVDADREAKFGRRFYCGQSEESEDNESNGQSSVDPSLVFLRDLAADAATFGSSYWLPAIDLGNSYLPLPDPDKVLNDWRHRNCRKRQPTKWRRIMEKMKTQVKKLKVWNRYEDCS